MIVQGTGVRYIKYGDPKAKFADIREDILNGVQVVVYENNDGMYLYYHTTTVTDDYIVSMVYISGYLMEVCIDKNNQWEQRTPILVTN